MELQIDLMKQDLMFKHVVLGKEDRQHSLRLLDPIAAIMSRYEQK